MDSVRLNGRQLSRAVVLPVNPALDRDAAKIYLDMRKDGLDSVGVEINGRHMVVVGKGLPEVGKGDRLEIGGKAAQILYRENETNDFKEGFRETAKGNKGAAYLLGGLAVGAVGAYVATLAGVVAFPIGLSMVACAVAGGLLAVVGRGLIGGLLADKKPMDLSVTERLADPGIKQISRIKKQAIIGDGSSRMALLAGSANA